jgi:hypothetical protein
MFADGKISADEPLHEIGRLVMQGQIVIIKGVFRQWEEELLALRRDVFRWGMETPPLDVPDPQTNCHCLQAGVSKLQKTPHVYHSFNFNRPSILPISLAGPLRKYFGALADFQNGITGNSARLEGFEDGQTLHPQLIQYPQGGSLFGRHVHPLLPQRIGLIAGLSKRGKDFTKGAACFEVDGAVIDTEFFHDFGDIALFRFDLPHWVSSSDPKDKFDWADESGRWSMVLPYY